MRAADCYEHKKKAVRTFQVGPWGEDMVVQETWCERCDLHYTSAMPRWYYEMATKPVRVYKEEG